MLDTLIIFWGGIMRKINYVNKKERKINGMYYVDSFKNKDTESKTNRWYLVMDPNHYIVKPVFDYLKYLYKSGASEGNIKFTADSLCHFYNFLRVHHMTGHEELTHEMLNAFIKYLSVIPKGLSRRLRSRLREPDENVNVWDIEYLPVHPYISNGEHVVRLLKEWFADYWSSVKQSNVTFYLDPKEYHVFEDELDWKYSFEYIRRYVNVTLDYLKYLGESLEWSHQFNPIDEKVAICERRYNAHNDNYYNAWDIEGRIEREANVKPTVNERQKKRVFFETELIKFLKADMLNKYPQRKFFFVMLLLSGARVSEILNVLLESITISIPRNAITHEAKISQAIVHWEDLFASNGISKNDIVINQDLEFQLKVVKRPAYESKLRRNKTSTSRFQRLKDHFELPVILDLGLESIFVQPKDIVCEFRDAIILNKKEDDIRGFMKSIMDYHSECTRKGIGLNNHLYDYQYKDWVIKIRKLIDNSWFGSVMREYLIERHLVQKGIQKEKKLSICKNYLFVNLKDNKGQPITPQVIRQYWFMPICDENQIMRYGIPINKLVNHAKKADLTVHSFRHTHISMRINNEALNGDFSRVNLANLKKDIGHVPSSTVAETVYYFSDLERKKQTYSKVFSSLLSNIENIILKEQDA